MLHYTFLSSMEFSIDFRSFCLILTTGFVFAMGCDSKSEPTAVIFLNHSGRELVGNVSLRNEWTKFSPFSCTIFTTEFRKGDPVKSELTDIFSGELLRHEIKLASSRKEPESNQSLYVSVDSKGKINAEWHDLSLTDHEIHSAAMHRSFKCLPVALQITGLSKPSIARVHQGNFTYTCTATVEGAPKHGYITTDSQSTTYLLISFNDDKGGITKIARITDAMLEQWITEKTNGLFVVMDLKWDKATVYKIADSDPDSYALSQDSMSGRLKGVHGTVILPLSISREQISKILSE